VSNTLTGTYEKQPDGTHKWVAKAVPYYHPLIVRIDEKAFWTQGIISETSKAYAPGIGSRPIMLSPSVLR
jgi:hypothetical protein